MPTDRDDLKAWLRQVLEHLGWAGSDLAKAIGAAPSTINRFLNDPDATHTLSHKSLKAIQEATGFEAMQFPGMVEPPGFQEPEALPFGELKTSGDAMLDEAVRFLCKQRQAFDAWQLRTEALSAAGFLFGDILLVDLGERPTAGDVVCAQIYDWTRGRAETVFRIFEPPYLIAATGNPRLMRPFLVDDERVMVKGTVLQTMRPRRAGSRRRVAA